MQIIKNYLTFLLFHLLFTYSLSHSWISCTDYKLDSPYYIDSSIEYNNNKCLGYPRNYNLQYQSDLNRGFGYDTGYNYKGMDCKYNFNNQYYNNIKMAKYYPGQQVCLTYPSKNHVSSDCTNIFIPDNGIKIYRSITKNSENELSNDFNKEYNHLNGIHQNGMIDYKGFQNCPGFCNNTDKTVCYVCFNLENELELGIYSFKWIWEFNKNEYYSTCWDAEIINGNSINTVNSDNSNQTELIRNLSISNYKYIKSNICNNVPISPSIEPNNIPISPSIEPNNIPISPSIEPNNDLLYNPNNIIKNHCKEKEIKQKEIKTEENNNKVDLSNNGATANVWEQCGGNNMPNKNCSNSKCIKYSPYYSQCLPDKLEKNALCGQNDEKEINWMHNYCINGYNCKSQPGSMDFRCI
jgi:hypothetical protein